MIPRGPWYRIIDVFLFIVKGGRKGPEGVFQWLMIGIIYFKWLMIDKFILDDWMIGQCKWLVIGQKLFLVISDLLFYLRWFAEQ